MIKKNDVIFVSGAAGFIGFHICKKLLLNSKNSIVAFDNINEYYDIKLKKDRLNNLKKISQSNQTLWEFYKGNLEDNNLLSKIFNKHKPKTIIHLAAQAGVRYSIKNPQSYINSNLVGFNNIIECSRNFSVKNFIYASSSSVYGGNYKLPFLEGDSVNHPKSLYAATKKSNELIAHAYSDLYNIPTTGLRLFTVYGPWGRPDMAPMIFTESIFKGKPIQIFNNGNSYRDFTYIDDVVYAIEKLIDKPAKPNEAFQYLNPDPSCSWAPYKIYNVGNNKKINLMEFINILEEEIGIKAIKQFLPMEKGDIQSTFSDTSSLEKIIGYKPNTNLREGVRKFVSWFRKYYGY